MDYFRNVEIFIIGFHTIDMGDRLTNTYCIETYLNEKPTTWIVKRTFTDFLILNKALYVNTGINFQLPSKSIFKLKNQSALESRREELEHYLKRVISHPVVFLINETISFLSVTFIS